MKSLVMIPRLIHDSRCVFDKEMESDFFVGSHSGTLGERTGKEDCSELLLKPAQYSGMEYWLAVEILQDQMLDSTQF